MSKKVVRGFLRSDAKPDFSSTVHTKPGELEYLMRKPVHSATLRSPIIKGIDVMISNGVRSLPLVNAINCLMGIVTATDVVNFLGGGDHHNIVRTKHKGRFFSALNEPLESIATKDVVHAEVCDSFVCVLEKMIKENVGAIPIVRGNKELVGIITEYDVVGYLSGTAVNENVGKRMTKNPVVASPGISIGAAAKLMVSNGFRRIPLKKDDAIVGIVTTMDIVRYIGEGSAFRKIMLDEMDMVMSLPVSQIMRTEVVSVSIDCPLGDVAPLLKSSGVGAVLVKKEGSTVGILTERDLLTALAAK